MVVLLLEDNDVFAEQVRNEILHSDVRLSECTWARCSSEAMQFAAQKAPDVLLADIQLEGESGIDAARALLECCPNMRVIFLTGNPGATHDIFDVMQPYGVYHKGYDPRTYILNNLRKIAVELEAENQRLRLSAHGKAVDLPLRDVFWIEHRVNDSFLHTSSGSVKLRIKLCDLLQHLDERFVRCHQSYIVNLDAVAGMEKDEFLLTNGMHVPISRTLKANAEKAFHRRKGGMA